MSDHPPTNAAYWKRRCKKLVLDNQQLTTNNVEMLEILNIAEKTLREYQGEGTPLSIVYAKILTSINNTHGAIMPTIIEDIPYQEAQKRCSDPEHNKPCYVNIPHGKRLRHYCPACGKETIIYN